MQGCLLQVNQQTGLAESVELVNWRESDLPG